MINIILSISGELDMALKTNIIDFCREKEIAFRSPKIILDASYSPSGVEYLTEFLKEGKITMQEYIAMLPAITRPQTEYKLHKLKTNVRK